MAGVTWQTVGLALSSQQLDSHRHLRIIYMYIYLLGSRQDEPNLNKHESRLPLFVRDFLRTCICIYYIFISFEKNHTRAQTRELDDNRPRRNPFIYCTWCAVTMPRRRQYSYTYLITTIRAIRPCRAAGLFQAVILFSYLLYFS